MLRNLPGVCCSDGFRLFFFVLLEWPVGFVCYLPRKILFLKYLSCKIISKYFSDPLSVMANRKLDPALEMHRQNWPETFDLRIMPFLLALQRVNTAEHLDIGWALARYRLSLAEFDVLASLRRAPAPYELTPSELQRAVVITSGGLSKVLQQLESRELVLRSTTEDDRRVKPVRLTAKGAKLIEQAIVELMAAANTAIRPRLSDKEIEQLTLLLEKLADMGQ